MGSHLSTAGGNQGKNEASREQPKAGQRAWHRFPLYLSSNPHTTLSPTPWSSAQEGMVRPRRMVEPLEARGQESFFCGPPGKLQPGQFLALMVVTPLPTYENRRAQENKFGQTEGEGAWPVTLKPRKLSYSWEDEAGLRCSSQVGASWMGVCHRGGMQAQDQAGRHRFQAPGNLNLIWPWVSIFPSVGPGPGAKGVSSGRCVAEKSYAQLVFMSTSAGSLWNLHAIHSMCRMEQDQVSWLGRCQGLGGGTRDTRDLIIRKYS